MTHNLMELLILTHGRADRQVTYNSLPPSVQKRVKFVVQDREKHLHGDRPLIVLPDEIRTIAKTRQWLVDNLDADLVLMMDDDLRFNVRRLVHDRLFVPLEYELEHMISCIEHDLAYYPQVGISQREGNNRVEAWFKEATRCTGMFGLDLKFVREHKLTFDRTCTKEDLDLTLQILDKGVPNKVLYGFTREAGNSGAAGGCSTYRTPEMMEQDAHYFAALWPGIVKVVEKETKGSWGGGRRVDVIIQWKKCYERAKAR